MVVSPTRLTRRPSAAPWLMDLPPTWLSSLRPAMMTDGSDANQGAARQHCSPPYRTVEVQDARSRGGQTSDGSDGVRGRAVSTGIFRASPSNILRMRAENAPLL